MHTTTPADANPPEHPVFDPGVLGAMFGTETAVIASVLQTFMAGARDSLAELTSAAARQDLAAVASLAHRITGACRMSGAIAMGLAARELEQAAKRGDGAAVPQGVDTLQAQWRLLDTAISGLTKPSQ